MIMGGQSSKNQAYYDAPDAHWIKCGLVRLYTEQVTLLCCLFLLLIHRRKSACSTDDPAMN